jgi:hypothetical protein
MQVVNALFLSPDASIWLSDSWQPRILHVFDRACNLINQRGEVLSIVTPQIGNGPFNLVVENEVLFSTCLDLESPISILNDRLTLGNLTINTSNAKLWSPRPDWESLHARRDDILKQVTSLCIDVRQPLLPHSLIANLSSALATANTSSILTITSQLAGLGAGLTPAGDDFILGAVLGAWIIHPLEVAKSLAEEITNTAAPLTTSLSAAWLRSAGRGEAGILWHQFFAALVSVAQSANRTYPTAVQEATDRILAVGETSGTDAMAGFINLFIYWGEHWSNL